MVIVFMTMLKESETTHTAVFTVLFPQIGCKAVWLLLPPQYNHYSNDRVVVVRWWATELSPNEADWREIGRVAGDKMLSP